MLFKLCFYISILFLVLPLFYWTIWEELCTVWLKAFFISLNQLIPAFCGFCNDSWETSASCSWVYSTVPDSGYEAHQAGQLLCQTRLHVPALCSSPCWGLPGGSDVFPFPVPQPPIQWVAVKRRIAFCKLLWDSWVQMHLRVRVALLSILLQNRSDLHLK